MDNVNKLGKILTNNAKEAGYNIRRTNENIPLIYRSVDSVSPAQDYLLEFELSDHPHAVSLNIFLSEVEPPCITEPIEDFVSSTTRCPTYGPADGLPHAGVDTITTVNIGGFSINPLGGVVVPMDGIYEVDFTNEVSVVAGWNGKLVTELVHNGVPFASKLFLSGCGEGDLCSIGWSVALHGYVECAAGDTIASVFTGTTLPIYAPSNFCGLFSFGNMVISLVAQTEQQLPVDGTDGVPIVTSSGEEL